MTLRDRIKQARRSKLRWFFGSMLMMALTVLWSWLSQDITGTWEFVILVFCITATVIPMLVFMIGIQYMRCPNCNGTLGIIDIRRDMYTRCCGLDMDCEF